MPMDNLVRWWNKSSQMDRQFGMSCYGKYRDKIFSLNTDTDIRRLCAVFSLLSPNNDYAGNLYSTMVVLRGHENRITVDRLKGLTTYRACAHRAYRVLDGEPILDVFGPQALKTYNFYCNLYDPQDREHVTIDGHMINLWRGEVLPLKTVAAKHRSPKLYLAIAQDFKDLSRALDILPCQLQGTLWWSWKRINRIRFESQMELPLDPSEIYF